MAPASWGALASAWFSQDKPFPHVSQNRSTSLPVVTNPYSTRPYQHVLEPLFAYLMIDQGQYRDKSLAGWYNVGPDECDCVAYPVIIWKVFLMTREVCRQDCIIVMQKLSDQRAAHKAIRASHNCCFHVYGGGKLIAHVMCMSVAAQLGIELVWPEITNAYGPGERSPRLVNTTVQKCLRGEAPQFNQVRNPGLLKRKFLIHYSAPSFFHHSIVRLHPSAKSGPRIMILCTLMMSPGLSV